MAEGEYLGTNILQDGAKVRTGFITERGTGSKRQMAHIGGSIAEILAS